MKTIKAQEMQLAILQAERDAALEMIAQLDQDNSALTGRTQLAQIKLAARDKLIGNLRDQIGILEGALQATDALLLPPDDLQAQFEKLFLDQIDIP